MFPLPILPIIPGWIKSGFAHVGDYVNPMIWLARSMRAIYDLMGWFFQFTITHPPRVRATGLTDYLYGNAIGIAGSLIAVIGVILLCWSMFQVRKILSVAEAVLIGVVVTAGAPVIFGLMDTAQAIGDTATNAVMFYHPHNPHEGLLSFGIDTGLNPLLSITAFFPMLILGGLNTGVVFFYEVINIVIKTLLLPALAIRPLGDKAKAFSDWLISMGMVSMVFGRPTMIICIEVGQWLGTHLLGGATAAVVFCLGAGLVASLYVQRKLYQQSQRVVARVSGATSARVWGKVTSTVTNKAKVDATLASRQHAGTMQPIPVATVKNNPTVVQQVNHDVKNHTKKLVANHIATKATVAATAAGTAGATAALATLASVSKTTASRADRKLTQGR